jgi:hypothetical protein
MEGMWCVGGLLLFISAVLWVATFMDLMVMPDEDFPGRYDKVLWVLAFLVQPVFIGPIAFALWKEKNRRRLRAQRQRPPEAPV